MGDRERTPRRTSRRHLIRVIGGLAATICISTVFLVLGPDSANGPVQQGQVDGESATGPRSDLDGVRTGTPTRSPGTNTSTSTGPTSAVRPAASVGIKVSHQRLVDPRGRPVRLLGYNFAGAEFACVEGQGTFDTPDGLPPSNQVIDAMMSWVGTTAIRLPLNEQCWLGLGVDPRYAGTAYRSAVSDVVARFNRRGLVVILDLHRSAPGSARSLNQEPMPDRDHSPAFWASVATTFRAWPGVAFDLFNEPFPFEEANSARAWECWRDGGCILTSTNSGRPYVTAGMSELLQSVRSAGARNVVFLGGLYWAESLTQWLRYRPADPAGQLGASFHAYSFNEYCVTRSCYNRDLAPIAASVPLLVGEIGPDLTLGSAGIDEDCPASAPRSTGFDASAFGWFDQHGVSYTAWSWNPWHDCWSLVRDWRGTPTGVWGSQYRARLNANRA